ncbi:MAG: LysR family transcriptional regulator [Epulopiscium sp.]|jgi:DNA-binding transcriptional LysR family regulator|nr:LysR family transcriptional regulator [Candidatus Epulonipiscium sp.]
MNLNQLYYFKTLAELEHYTKAAEKLSISQPTLSHSISTLEQELGAFLFEKQGRNVVLTKYGRIYLFYVENALHQLELGKNQIERMVSEGGGHVDLAYMASVGTNFLPEMISAFFEEKKNKNITFSCYEGSTKNLIYNLKREKYDLIFCSHVENERDIEFVPVYEQILIAIVPINHPLAEKTKVELKDISGYPFISYTKESGMRKIIDDLFIKAEMIPNVLCQFEDMNSIAGLVAANQGVAIITDNPSIGNYNVKRLELDAPHSKRQVYLAYVKNRYLPPSVQKFKDFIIKRTKQR